jgi:hypothetical protein
VNDRFCGGTDFTEGKEWDAILIMYRGASMASLVREKQQCEKWNAIIRLRCRVTAML